MLKINILPDFVQGSVRFYIGCVLRCLSINTLLSKVMFCPSFIYFLIYCKIFINTGPKNSNITTLPHIYTVRWKKVSSLQFTVTSIDLPSDFYFCKLTQPLTVSRVYLLYIYTVKEKGGKPNRKPHPFPMVQEIHTETSSLRTLKIMPRNFTKIQKL
jgi:hypothetical protein